MICCYSDFFLLRGFVLKTALQQTHLTSSIVRKIPQNVHRFWPISYLILFGTALA
jgi:hypothetical protein